MFGNPEVAVIQAERSKVLTSINSLWKHTKTGCSLNHNTGYSPLVPTWKITSLRQPVKLITDLNLLNHAGGEGVIS